MRKSLRVKEKLLTRHSHLKISKDRNSITSNEQQFDLWAEFLEKIEAEEDEPEVVLHAENEEDLPPPSLEEIKDCVKQLKKGKGTGPDDIPIEQFKCSEDACEEHWHTIAAV